MERTIISFDYAIKYILRDKANFDILSGFLTELLCRPVSVQEILESQANTDRKDGKTPRLDLKAKIDDGEIAVFEIQYEDQVDFLGKALYNVSKAVVEQVTIGEAYDVKKVYSVNIAYDAMGAKKEYLFTASLREFRGVNFDEVIPFSQTFDPLSDAQNDIHPEYFLILPKKFDGQMRSKFDEWVYVLKHSSVKSEFTAAGVQAAGEKLDVLKMTPEERADYEREKQFYANLKMQKYTAELKAKKEGEETGVEKEKENTVIRGHKAGASIEIISMMTGLSPDQITEILKQNGLI
jgi:predicted transposase/invertase (TIGR01784 family)